MDLGRIAKTDNGKWMTAPLSSPPWWRTLRRSSRQAGGQRGFVPLAASLERIRQLEASN